MAAQVLDKDDQYVLNQCTRYLARNNSDGRHNFGHLEAEDPRGDICEVWRFPIIDAYSDGADFVASYAFNQVTFVYARREAPRPQRVSLIGTFANLYESIPLEPVRFWDEEAIGYYAVSLRIPKGELHTYRFIVDGEVVNDPINPQEMRLTNGQTWSRFFTELCTQPVSFETWELALLDRLTDQILPFRTKDGENFLNRFYDNADRQAKETQYLRAYRLDQSVGVVNFIDKLVAREERHRLIDYRICLDIIDTLLRQRNPLSEPSELSREVYTELYDQMASGNVPGWDFDRYGSPAFFLWILRRHAFTGAFSHPRHGGNVGAAAWAYLEERYRDPATGETLFNWRAALEKPLGTNEDYRG